MNTPIPTPSPQVGASYYSESDLELINSAPVKVIVKYILKCLADRNVSYRARVRDPEKVQVIKIRSIETSSEIVIVVPNRRPDEFSIRFVRHVDRYDFTTPSRIVIRKIDFDCRIADSNNLAAYLDSEVIPWLIPNSQNLKPSLAPMLVLEDIDKCPSSLVAIGFVIAHSSISSDATGVTATIYNRNRKMVREGRKLPDVVLSNTNEKLVGRIYVEFHNGDYLFMTEKVFRQQFSFFREGMIDMSIRH